MMRIVNKYKAKRTPLKYKMTKIEVENGKSV
jgi:hypothetical protein